ncbi:MAG TPA: MazG nucleotide pyrophosphohydrolase domain-containing protein [bacterium]
MGQIRTRRQRPASVGTPEREFTRLLATARRLQGPRGCAWDRAQTVESLMPCLVEETWELFDAVRTRHTAALAEEMGDVLYTVLFLIMLAERDGRGSLGGVLAGTRAKMVRRHPHVFGAKSADTAQEAYRHWQASKKLERRHSASPSKQLRKLLVDWWDWLGSGPDAPGQAGRALRALTATRRQPRGTRGRDSARS